MTEQEQFELPKSLLDLRSLLLHTKLSVIAFSDTITLLDQVEIDWQAAQQQKEGYVLVPVEQAKDTQRVDWLADVNNKIGNVQLPTACVEKNPHSLRAAIDAAMIAAAQEAE